MLPWTFATLAAAYDPIGLQPDCGPETPSSCPSELPGSWELISWIPEGSVETVRPAELALGSGIHLDEALAIGSGRWDTTVAVLDSGIYWQDAAVSAKVRLNLSELPPPQGADGLPVPAGSDEYDLADYANDLRVDWAAGADTADSALDPSDLIAVFSDGEDDDLNGYVDDIAGWDFFGMDNDPYADLQSGQADHGTGVMEGAAAGGNDGGDIGVCPDCSILPIRIGDSFVVGGDRVGMGLVFATVSGVDAAGMAIGAMSHPAHASAAVAAAIDAGVVVVGAAGDEMSWHQNLPAADDGILYVHSIRGNNMEEEEGTYSYFNTWNCNNIGPRVDLVAPSNACATGAVAAIAGGAALLRAIGRDHGLELTGDEIRALLTSTADDVTFTATELEEAEAWPTHAGWDPWLGAGRMQIGRAAAAIASGDLPPVARFHAPRWFAHGSGDLSVSGLADAPRDTLANWRLEAGAGNDPESWTLVAEGQGPIDGDLGTLDLRPYVPAPAIDLTYEHLLDRVARAHEGLVLLRLTATDSAGRSSEARTGVWVDGDPDRLDGFPVDLGASAEGAPVLVDLDGDGVHEIIVATSDGTIHALNAQAEPHPGFPVSTGAWPSFAHGAAGPYASGAVSLPTPGTLAGAAVGDVDGDGSPDIVVGTTAGSIDAFSAQGERLPGFPTFIVGREPEAFTPGHGWENGIFAAPALGDVDGDGALEIVIGAMDQRLYVFGGDGQTREGFPLELCHPDGCGFGARIVASPALGDVDADGDLDAVLGTNEIPPGAAAWLFAVDLTTATFLPSFPLARKGLINQSILPMIGEGHPSSVALYDHNGDGTLEMVSEAMLGTDGVVDLHGNEVLDLPFTADHYGLGTNLTEPSLVSLASNPAVGDLDGDGVLDIAMTGAGVFWLVALPVSTVEHYEHGVGAWSGATGDMLPGFPRQIDDISFFVSPSMADITGDGRPELIATSGGHFVGAWDAEGTSAPGWPKRTQGWSTSGVSVGDVDGDGFLEAALTTRQGWIHVWRTQGKADQKGIWPSPRHDPQNTGNVTTPLVAQAGPPAIDDDEKAGCCRKDGQASLLLLPTIWLARRRRQ